MLLLLAVLLVIQYTEMEELALKPLDDFIPKPFEYPIKYYPTEAEFSAKNRAQILWRDYRNNVGYGTEGNYVVPEGYTLYITSATLAYALPASSGADNYCTIYKISNTPGNTILWLRNAATAAATTSTNALSASFPMPIVVRQFENVGIYQSSTMQVTATFVGWIEKDI
jgi:hypothetical protein